MVHLDFRVSIVGLKGDLGVMWGQEDGTYWGYMGTEEGLGLRV